MSHAVDLVATCAHFGTYIKVRGSNQLTITKMENHKQYRGHVVVLPYPSQGHINPLLQFAKRLASKGVKATLATTSYTVSSICVPTVGVEPISDGFDESGFAQAADEETFLQSFKANGSRTLSQVLKKFEDSEFPVNCVVYDSFLPWALDVAKKHGIYGASFFTNSASVCSILLHIHHGLISLPFKLDDMPLLLHGLPPLDIADLPGMLKKPESNPAYLRMQLNQYSNLDKADWIFTNTFKSLESKAAKAVAKLWPAKLIGPMIPSAYLDDQIKGDSGYGASLWKPLGEECIKWLETKAPKSVVYVSFGSMVSLTAEQMKEFALGLKETGVHFIWVVRASELGKLTDEIIDSVKEKGLLVTWCNQLEALAHEAIGCFVTHCGWNSILEGLSLGVPMVAVPKWADQMTNAKFVEEIWEVGVRAKEDDEGIVRKEEFVSCLKEVMEGERSKEIKKNSRKWRELAEKEINKGGSSDICISEFVELLVPANKRPEAKAFLNGKD
ncbi:UDP-glycosyltransferase 74B1-like [Argentina anserina]|uniref:UDP-glycosyltransferase 74B1-like n=1 Tax=Argentina anserina TaxID=57926 RepID=UPI0021768E82|nr:UDP-glycosyltransferase 74B1-like [Potentilla anserina]